MGHPGLHHTYNEKAQTYKVKVASAAKAAELRMPKKRAHWGGTDKGAPKKAVLPSIASGARRQTGLSRPTIPSSVAGSRRTVALRKSLLSPSILPRNPEKRQVAETPV